MPITATAPCRRRPASRTSATRPVVPACSIPRVQRAIATASAQTTSHVAAAITMTVATRVPTYRCRSVRR